MSEQLTLLSSAISARKQHTISLTSSLLWPLIQVCWFSLQPSDILCAMCITSPIYVFHQPYNPSVFCSQIYHLLIQSINLNMFPIIGRRLALLHSLLLFGWWFLYAFAIRLLMKVIYIYVCAFVTVPLLCLMLNVLVHLVWNLPFCRITYSNHFFFPPNANYIGTHSDSITQ